MWILKIDKIMKNFAILMLLIVFVTSFSFGQRFVPENACPSPNMSERAQFIVDSFLRTPYKEDDRIETSATNETVEQIRPVADESICAELNNIVNNTPKYKRINENIDPKDTKYFYRTDNLFYIFWSQRPEYDDIPSPGPRRLFIIVSADFQNVWEKYY